MLKYRLLSSSFFGGCERKAGEDLTITASYLRSLQAADSRGQSRIYDSVCYSSAPLQSLSLSL